MQKYYPHRCTSCRDISLEGVALYLQEIDWELFFIAFSSIYEKVKETVCHLSGIGMEETYLLAMWCSVYKGRDSNLGLDTELANSSCDAKGKPYKCSPRRGRIIP